MRLSNTVPLGGAPLELPLTNTTLLGVPQRLPSRRFFRTPLLWTICLTTSGHRNCGHSGLQFDTPDRYEYYRGASNAPCGGQGARALPENAYYCFAESDEYVAFDLDWFTSYLDEHPGGATTFLILAHEWGHAVQDTWVEQQLHPEWAEDDPRQELSADCLAGVWMEDALRRGTLIEESGDADAIFRFLWEGGSGPWFAPGDHGTKEQRQRAFADGYAQDTEYCRTNY